MKKILKKGLIIAIFLITFVFAVNDVYAATITKYEYASSSDIKNYGKNVYYPYRYRLNGTQDTYCVDPTKKIVRNNLYVVESINIDLKACANGSNSRDCQLASVFQHGYGIEYNSKVTGSANEKYGSTLYAIRAIWGSTDYHNGGFIRTRNLFRASDSYNDYTNKAQSSGAYYGATTTGRVIMQGAYRLYKTAQTNDFWYPEVKAANFEIIAENNVVGKEHTVEFETTFDSSTKNISFELSGPIKYVKHSLKDGKLKLTIKQTGIIPVNSKLSVKVNFTDNRNITKIYRYGGASGYQTYLVVDDNAKKGSVNTEIDTSVKFDCDTVTVENFKEYNGTPALAGSYNKQTYININAANPEWGEYYLKACPPVTCATYDGSVPINSGDSAKFDQNRYNSLPNEEAKKHYIENCPCACEDYNNGLYQAGCKLPTNPPGGKYVSNIADSLNDDAYKEYIAHCPPCNPCDPEKEKCDSSCNLASVCPSPDSATGAIGSIEQNNIIDRQACAESANIEESQATDSGFIVDLGTPYCKAACTYDISEFTYPGAKLGLGSGRFIKFEDISMTIKTTCTTSAIKYDDAITDYNNATTDAGKKGVLDNLNKCLSLSGVETPEPIVNFLYEERTDHEGFKIDSKVSNTNYIYCGDRLKSNVCTDVKATTTMPLSITTIGAVNKANRSSTVIFTEKLYYRPKTVYYSTFYEAKILKDAEGEAAAKDGKAIKIGGDGRIFPINFDTEPGEYKYHVLTDLNHKTLKELQAKYASMGVTCALDYVCNYNVHKFACDDKPCDPEADASYEAGINSTFRFVSNNNINPNERELGANWLDAKGIDTANEIQALGDEVYADENLEYSFTLTPEIMKKLRNLNNTAEGSGGYANDTLICTIVNEETGYYTCKSETLKSVFSDTTYQVKNDDEIFTSYVDGTPWK